MNTKQKEVALNGLAIIFGILVLLNILGSQIISPLYSEVARGDKSATAAFLKESTKLPEFNFFLDQAKADFGPAIVADVYRDALNRQTRINDLESLLQLNPKSKEILIELSSLYKNMGNEKKADDYLHQAMALDPQVK